MQAQLGFDQAGMWLNNVDILAYLEEIWDIALQLLETLTQETLRFVRDHPVLTTLIIAALIMPHMVHLPLLQAFGDSVLGPLPGMCLVCI